MYRENAAGGLYGLTFTSHNTGVVLNGSRLGKEYAANAIVDRLENSHQYEHLTNNPQPQSTAQFSPQQPHPSQEAQPMHHTAEHPESSSIRGSIGSLFDIPILPNGDGPEEEMCCRRMQRKKKKGRRM